MNTSIRFYIHVWYTRIKTSYLTIDDVMTSAPADRCSTIFFYFVFSFLIYIFISGLDRILLKLFLFSSSLIGDRFRGRIHKSHVRIIGCSQFALVRAPLAHTNTLFIARWQSCIWMHSDCIWNKMNYEPIAFWFVWYAHLYVCELRVMQGWR